MDYVRVAFLQTVAIIVVLLLIVAYVWWHHTGWVAFGPFTTGDLPQWAPADPHKSVARLRFKDCAFSVKRSGDSAATTYDVTAVLNAMAKAYTNGNVYNTPPALALDRPLNAFSFAIPGFNDAAMTIAGQAVGTVADPTKTPWCTGTAPRGDACSSDADCPGGAPGSCTGWPTLVIGAPLRCSSNADCGEDGVCVSGTCGCRNDYDCKSGGTCTNGVCSKGLKLAQTGDACLSDDDCNYVVGSCQDRVCTDIPGQPGQCKWCVADSQCGGGPGSCTGTPYVAAAGSSPAQPAVPGVCGICPGAATVSLVGYVRAI